MDGNFFQRLHDICINSSLSSESSLSTGCNADNLIDSCLGTVFITGIVVFILLILVIVGLIVMTCCMLYKTRKLKR